MRCCRHSPRWPITSNGSEQARAYLLSKADSLFPDKGDAVLMSLARRRFGFDSGDWHLIPAMRLQDAIRSLEEKSAEKFKPEDEA